MSAVIALLCLYLGINNIKKAFTLAPFGMWGLINWLLVGTGVLLLIFVIPLVREAIKDYNKAKEDALQKEKEKEEASKKKYSISDEEGQE